MDANRATDIEALKLCVRCPALGKHHVAAEGSPSASVFIIGGAPGMRDFESGQPLSSSHPGGEVLDYFLDEAGIGREDVYITNVVKCHPPGNRPVHPEEADECMNAWLKDELREMAPRIVVLLGKDAWKHVTHEKMPFVHGEYTKSPKGNYFLTLYHPSYFIRSGNVEEFVRHGATLKRLLSETSNTA